MLNPPVSSANVDSVFSRYMLQAIGDHLRQRPELLPQTLSTLFEITLFEDCTNQWSLSRPMLSLILLNEQIYHELKHRIIASQPVRAAGPWPGLRLQPCAIENVLQATLTHGYAAGGLPSRRVA